MSEVTVKVIFGEEVRRIVFTTENIGYDFLCAIIRDSVGSNRLSENLNIKWKDPEDDFVIISCDHEVKDAVNCCVKAGCTVRLYVGGGNFKSASVPEGVVPQAPTPPVVVNKNASQFNYTHPYPVRTYKRSAVKNQQGMTHSENIEMKIREKMRNKTVEEIDQFGWKSAFLKPEERVRIQPIVDEVCGMAKARAFEVAGASAGDLAGESVRVAILRTVKSARALVHYMEPETPSGLTYRLFKRKDTCDYNVTEETGDSAPKLTAERAAKIVAKVTKEKIGYEFGALSGDWSADAVFKAILSSIAKVGDNRECEKADTEKAPSQCDQNYSVKMARHTLFKEIGLEPEPWLVQLIERCNGDVKTIFAMIKTGQDKLLNTEVARGYEFNHVKAAAGYPPNLAEKIRIKMQDRTAEEMDQFAWKSAFLKPGERIRVQPIIDEACEIAKLKVQELAGETASDNAREGVRIAILSSVKCARAIVRHMEPETPAGLTFRMFHRKSARNFDDESSADEKVKVAKLVAKLVKEKVNHEFGALSADWASDAVYKAILTAIAGEQVQPGDEAEPVSSDADYSVRMARRTLFKEAGLEPEPWLVQLVERCNGNVAAIFAILKTGQEQLMV